MTNLFYSHGDVSHAVFNSEPKTSVVCGFISKIENNYWEWQIRHRTGIFDKNFNCYRPSLIKFGYAKHREIALRQVSDYIKSGDW